MVFKRAGEKKRGLTVSSMLSRTSSEGEELVVYRQTQIDSFIMMVWLVFQSVMSHTPQTCHFSEVVVDCDHTENKTYAPMISFHKHKVT